MLEKNLPPKNKRLKILEKDEIQTIYSLPVFTDEDRQHYFALSPAEKAAMEQLHTVKSRVYYILQLGYFKAQHQFFIFTLADVREDVQYIQHLYFPFSKVSDLDIAKGTRLKQQKLILQIFDYRYCQEIEREQLSARAQEIAKIDSQPIYIFRDLMQLLTKQRLIAPKYTVMQAIVGKALQTEQDRLVDLVETHLMEQDITALNALLSNPQGLYEITRLKHKPKDFSNSEIAKEIHRGEKIKFLYKVAKRVLPLLEISNESIKYYASLVNYYSVFQLNQFNKAIIYIYLLCFTYHRYQKLHDNLINCFIHRVRKLVDEAKEDAKIRVYMTRVEYHQNLPKVAQVIKLFTDETIKENTLFKDVQAQAFEILTPELLNQIADHITQTIQLDEILFQWEYIDQIANCFKRRLRPIIRVIDFSASNVNEPLLVAIRFVQSALKRKKPLTQYKLDARPITFIPAKSKRYLYTRDENENRELVIDRYEFLIYRLLHNQLQSGDIFCHDSVHFRSFDDDLLSDAQWKEKKQLIKNAQLPILQQTSTKHLKHLKTLLEERLETVNQHITSGQNKHIQIKKWGHKTYWSLPYSRVSDDVNNPFFDTLPQVDIQSILHFTNQYCPFMSAFTHVLHRYKQNAQPQVLTACLLALGTNMGLGRMSQISDISYQILSSTSNNFIRLETLKRANDIVNNRMTQLPIFPLYDIGNAIHSSSDGQKFETQTHTINARYSPKYFGLKKGVVSYTLVANHIPINAKIIGANEHESHYVFDLLFNNTTDLHPSVHSTDTHGTNEVNFGILHFFAYQFAPRYRDLYAKVSKGLYGFKHPSQYPEHWLLKPIRKINENLVSSEWENIQRIIVSLALKTVTQSIIIGKLSAYARKNKTKRALWEYDNIIRSLYLLDYIDSLSLRQNVQQALNRGESYHKLRKAVSYANFGKLRFRTEAEQQIWNECARLITNCIIFYNATILSEFLIRETKLDRYPQIVSIKRISPVAWQHINFYGRYEFAELPHPIDIDAIVQDLINTYSRSTLSP